MEDRDRPIGFFDSGLGGISVLRTARALLPQEDYIYFGDSRNAPYGTRPREEIAALAACAIDRLLGQGVKAIVIACNTVTSVAAAALRAKYPAAIIVATEPALKPAVLARPGGRVVVMATPATLSGAKFRRLMAAHARAAAILPCPCPGLMEFVERGETDSANLRAYLADRFRKIDASRPDAIVLGCTHYPFVKDAIQAVAGPQAAIFDGSGGIARQLRRRLAAADLLTGRQVPGRVIWQNSDPALLDASRRLLTLGR